MIPIPQWYTPYYITLETEAFRLLNFNPTPNQHKNTILLVPPQAGHHSCVADYGKNQSLVRVALNNHHNTYAIEWKSAVWARRNENLDSLVSQLKSCHNHLDTDITLVGLCQGGWLSTIYTALYPDKINRLILAAAPIDFAVGNSIIKHMVNLLPQSYYKYLVYMGSGLMLGEFMLTGFRALRALAAPDPLRYYWQDPLVQMQDLYLHSDDPVWLARHKHFQTWWTHTQNLAGQWYLEAVDLLFRKNLLVQNKLKIHNRTVNLKNITCPTILLAGKRDHITPPPQLHNLKNYISSQTIIQDTADAGHIGVFINSQVLKNYWDKYLKYTL